ncbi:uncharacterized protein LY89DRAFT_53039 [Mollisia scopiformis]|uniref:Uncharacterized protein n=1 Tax=Mollisia scopiformis TaxID=149040 RepID=A0A194XB57_MOLSC|nr:uncharacterized protein LY89DRAFT_53039 [Mollisia scopiformis]KUJ17410.1 hypothetical protein LY89DRAFT_53039 [Mollisia scopiformis]
MLGLTCDNQLFFLSFLLSFFFAVFLFCCLSFFLSFSIFLRFISSGSGNDHPLYFLRSLVGKLEVFLFLRVGNRFTRVMFVHHTRNPLPRKRDFYLFLCSIIYFSFAFCFLSFSFFFFFFFFFCSSFFFLPFLSKSNVSR